MSTADASHSGQRVAVIANMQKMSEKEAIALRRALSAHGIEYLEWFEPRKATEVTRSARQAVEQGVRTVVVCGGDGTVRLAAEALVGTGVALSVVPQGTGNVFVQGVGLPTDLDGIARSVAEGSRETIDTGMCNGVVFNLTAGSGFDVGMVAPSDAEKARHGFFAYVRAAIGEMLHRRPFDARVTIDDAPFYDGPSTGVLVGKLGSQLRGVKVFPDASPADGLLHVAVVRAVGPLSWLSLIAATLLRRQAKSRQAEVGRGTKVSVRFSRRRRFELDGDILGRTAALECEVRPDSLVVCTGKPRMS